MTRIAFVDIETTPLIGYSWKTFDTNLIKVKEEWFMLSFAVKWAHERKTRVYGLCDFPGYRKNRSDDRLLVKKLWDVFHKADLIIGQNSDRFDIRKSNARFLFHGLPPPSPYKTVDTLKLARKYFSMTSNRLGELGKFMGLGEKKETGGFGLWEGCMAGEKAAWDKMKRYNKRDVILTEKVYQRLRGWHTAHPNITLTGEPSNHLCPACGKGDVIRRGWALARSYRSQRFQCLNPTCGKWSNGKRERISGELLT